MIAHGGASATAPAAPAQLPRVDTRQNRPHPGAISLTDTPRSVGPGPLVPPVVSPPTRRAGPSARILVAAGLTTVVAVAGLFFLGREDRGASDRARDRNSPSLYTVRTGDTTSSVARLHGLDTEALLDALDLSLADSLRPGEAVEIPPLPVGTDEWPRPLLADPVRAQQHAWFDRWAEEYGVPTALVESLAWTVSSWDNTTIKENGDMGIGRVDTDLVGWINNELIRGETPVDPRSPEGNIRLMAAHLGHLLEVTGGDHATSIATYFMDGTEPSDGPWDLGLRRVIRGVLTRVPVFASPAPPSATTTTTTATDG